MRLSPFFPVVGSVEVSGSFIDRLTNPPKRANFKPSRYKGVVRPFLEPLRQAAGEVFRSDFSLSPSPTPSPPNYLPAGKEQAFLSSKLTQNQQPLQVFNNRQERMSKTMNIGIDHGYYAIKTRHFSFPAGIAVYSHEPYTLQNTLEYGGKFFVCGTGRQPILRNKMENDNYYLLTLAAIAKEIKQRGEKAECSVNIAAGLPLAGFGREKKPFREYLLRSSQPVCFKFEGIPYKVTIEDVKLFPQGYSAIAIHPELIQNEPSVLLMDIGGWTVDLMRLDNGVPNASTCRSLELGMIRCIDETKEQVRRDVGLSVTDAQVERVLAGKACSMDEEARSIIQKQGRLYTERLLSAAMESGFDLKAIPVIMLGGGAAVVKGNLSAQDGLCRAFALIDNRVNAEGFERILGQLSGGVSKG